MNALRFITRVPIPAPLVPDAVNVIPYVPGVADVGTLIRTVVDDGADPPDVAIGLSANVAVVPINSPTAERENVVGEPLVWETDRS